MNEKFYALHEEKQRRILNAGFLVFSQNSYKKSPMQEIADHAGISKSLLFHYFRNKRELYLFLWEQACRITTRSLEAFRCYEGNDLFEMMERGMGAKLEIMRKYPNMTTFVVKAFYETDPELNAAIQESYQQHFDSRASDALMQLNPDDFIPGLDLSMMHREMYLASVGYLWEVFQKGGTVDADRLEQDFSEMLSFWKKIYLRKEQ